MKSIALFRDDKSLSRLNTSPNSDNPIILQILIQTVEDKLLKAKQQNISLTSQFREK